MPWPMRRSIVMRNRRLVGSTCQSRRPTASCTAANQLFGFFGTVWHKSFRSCGIQGAAVSASDVSNAMANEAQRRYEEAVASGQQAPAEAPTFSATDLESITGSFHTVACLDVMIHYPQVAPHQCPCAAHASLASVSALPTPLCMVCSSALMQ